MNNYDNNRNLNKCFKRMIKNYFSNCTGIRLIKARAQLLHVFEIHAYYLRF